MPIPTLADLPPPPPGKTGFPWTEECPRLNDPGLPRVSIVTPSFNQGAYLEETLRSVLLQGYPNLEYIVMDGGSADQSVEIIRRYAPWLASWVSEPDRGQVDAIAKGWARSSGAILAYLNSDDTYLPNAIANAVNALTTYPAAVAICGGELLINAQGIVIAERFVQSATLDDLLHFKFVPQPSIFLRRETFLRAGGLDSSFQVVFDFELWTRVVQLGAMQCIPQTLGTTRWHTSAKSFTQRLRVLAELERVIQKIFSSAIGARFSARERRALAARLHLLAVGIHFDTMPHSIRQVIAHSIAGLRDSLSIAPELIRVIAYRARVLTVYYWRKYAQHQAIEKLPWGFGYTGIRWNIWHQREQGRDNARRD
jgi:GT2 family glycosyltransferase